MYIQEINIKYQIYNYYFDNLVKVKNLATKNIAIDEKNFNGLTIYFHRYVHCKSIKILTLYFHGLM